MGTFGTRLQSIFPSGGHCTALTTVAARVVCFLIEGAAAGSWLLQALPGSRWNMADGIPAEVAFGCPMFAMDERNAR
ncbi:hypothetical protein PSAB6_150076 [Paraburkholderia sabiae]|nr:hypothetical protein PSAB6_150076 [Paraburkholderia sabiae]